MNGGLVIVRNFPSFERATRGKTFKTYLLGSSRYLGSLGPNGIIMTAFDSRLDDESSTLSLNHSRNTACSAAPCSRCWIVKFFPVPLGRAKFSRINGNWEKPLLTIETACRAPRMVAFGILPDTHLGTGRSCDMRHNTGATLRSAIL